MAERNEEVSDRINPNKAEDNDLTRLDTIGQGNGDSSNGALRDPIANEGLNTETIDNELDCDLVDDGDREASAPVTDEETGGMNSGTSSGIHLDHPSRE